MMLVQKALKSLERLPKLGIWPAAVFVLCSAAALLVAQQLRPTRYAERQGVTLGAMLPPTVQQWREVKSNLVQMSLTPDGIDRSEAVAATYDDTAMTSYADPQGNLVMVALAYGRLQRQEGKIHRPELCYSSQGFTLKSSTAVPLALSADGGADGKVQVHRLEVVSRGRREVVSYWIRIGDLFSTSAFATRTHIMKVGLQGEIPDGILFRVSQIIPSDLTEPQVEAAYARQEAFMATLAGSLTGGGKKMLVGDRLALRAGGSSNAAS
jgi:EpsI family protein